MPTRGHNNATLTSSLKALRIVNFVFVLKVQLLVNRLTSSSIGFSVGGLFVLDKSSVLTVSKLLKCFKLPIPKWELNKLTI